MSKSLYLHWHAGRRERGAEAAAEVKVEIVERTPAAHVHQRNAEQGAGVRGGSERRGLGALERREAGLLHPIIERLPPDPRATPVHRKARQVVPRHDLDDVHGSGHIIEAQAPISI